MATTQRDTAAIVREHWQRQARSAQTAWAWLGHPRPLPDAVVQAIADGLPTTPEAQRAAAALEALIRERDEAVALAARLQTEAVEAATGRPEWVARAIVGQGGEA